jgi:hypothetical protein
VVRAAEHQTFVCLFWSLSRVSFSLLASCLASLFALRAFVCVVHCCTHRKTLVQLALFFEFTRNLLGALALRGAVRLFQSSMGTGRIDFHSFISLDFQNSSFRDGPDCAPALQLHVRRPRALPLGMANVKQAQFHSRREIR